MHEVFGIQERNTSYAERITLNVPALMAQMDTTTLLIHTIFIFGTMKVFQGKDVKYFFPPKV
jgi:hypothetical protein